ncbi:hypothetical protein BB559_002135 [Furculomyces boomerangus]|uniref:Uncharacterized protein n=2 Tax=Harpellales TaxID=61421 RepID=A0A2T9YXS2_9FUNG|nr:hypothetical protein BB559_002135 [Furculomyces boomerangus]PVZ99988.1 hypothetical protein BB558_003973 [Smittium angustum]
MFSLKKLIKQTIDTNCLPTQISFAPQNVYNNIIIYIDPVSKSIIANSKKNSLSSPTTLGARIPQDHLKISETSQNSDIIVCVPLVSTSAQPPKIVYNDRVVGCRVTIIEKETVSGGSSYKNKFIESSQAVETSGYGTTTAINFVFENPKEIPIFISTLVSYGVVCEKKKSSKKQTNTSSKAIPRGNSVYRNDLFDNELNNSMFSQQSQSNYIQSAGSMINADPINQFDQSQMGTINNPTIINRKLSSMYNIDGHGIGSQIGKRMNVPEFDISIKRPKTDLKKIIVSRLKDKDFLELVGQIEKIIEDTKTS